MRPLCHFRGLNAASWNWLRHAENRSARAPSHLRGLSASSQVWWGHVDRRSEAIRGTMYRNMKAKWGLPLESIEDCTGFVFVNDSFGPGPKHTSTSKTCAQDQHHTQEDGSNKGRHNIRLPECDRDKVESPRYQLSPRVLEQAFRRDETVRCTCKDYYMLFVKLAAVLAASEYGFAGMS